MPGSDRADLPLGVVRGDRRHQPGDRRRSRGAAAGARDRTRGGGRLDLACSRFRADSELALVNRGAGRAVRVSPLLLEALVVALDAAEATDGLVDPTVGAAMRGIGYDRDFDIVVTAGDRAAFALVPASGWRSVAIDTERGLVTVRPGTELDLGATAKAFAADRIAGAVAEAT